MPTRDDLRRRSSRRSSAAPCWSTDAAPRSSPRATCATRSTSVWKAATPSSPDRCCRPTSTSCCSPSPGQELEGKNRLARIGFDRVIGYLDEPFEVMFEHRDDVQVASRLTAKAFDERAAELADLQIVDVRNPGEVEAGAIPNAIAIPVGQLPAAARRARRHRADRRVLRRRLPVLGRGKPVAATRLHRRERHPGRLRRLGRSHPERLSDTRRPTP